MATVRHLGLFPFCVGTYPPRPDYIEQLPNQVGQLTDYPFQLPVRLCTRMWWTVKHWRITFDYYQFQNLSDQYDPGDYTLIDQNINVTTKASEPVTASGFADYVKSIEEQRFSVDTSERQLVCVTSGTAYEEAARMNVWNIQLSREFLVEGGSGTSTITSQLYFYTNWDQQQFGFGPPFCFGESEDDRINLWTAMSFEFRGWSSWLDSDGENGSGTFSVLGATRSFAISRSSLAENDTETISNLVIEPAEFWEYDPNDGLGPIYDKTTGKQLRPFPDSYARSSASVS